MRTYPDVEEKARRVGTEAVEQAIRAIPEPKRDLVYSRWIARPQSARTYADTNSFVDELWADRIWLGTSLSLHAQQV